MDPHLTLEDSQKVGTSSNHHSSKPYNCLSSSATPTARRCSFLGERILLVAVAGVVHHVGTPHRAMAHVLLMPAVRAALATRFVPVAHVELLVLRAQVCNFTPEHLVVLHAYAHSKRGVTPAGEWVAHRVLAARTSRSLATSGSPPLPAPIRLAPPCALACSCTTTTRRQCTTTQYSHSTPTHAESIQLCGELALHPGHLILQHADLLIAGLQTLPIRAAQRLNLLCTQRGHVSALNKPSPIV